MYRPKFNSGGGFPDQFASDEEKKSTEYGLLVGQAISSEWFSKDGGGSLHGEQRAEFIKRRLYARGAQPVEKYKNELAVNGDISYLNLDWTPVPIIPKYVDVVVNGIGSRLQSVKVESIDDVSAMKRQLHKNQMEADMLGKEMLTNLKDKTGIDAFNFNQEDVPDSEEELSLYMSLKYKDKIEVAEEIAIETILNINNYDETKRRVDEDNVVLGVSCVKHSFDIHDGVRIEYVDPENWIYSPTEDPYFKDCYYFGEVKSVHVSELKKINPGLSQEEIKTISKLSSKYNGYGDYRGSGVRNSLDDGLITLLYFSYKTDSNIVYKVKTKENGGQKPIEKDDSFNPPESEDMRFIKMSRRIDVWYEGVMVLGTDTLLKWDLMTNMVRPKSAFQKAIPPYLASAIKLSKGNIDSLVKRMIPFADQIQLTHLKLQQVVSKMIPDGVFIDADGLNSVDLGNGASYNPAEALSMYFQTGSVVGRSYTEDGEFNNARVPIQELTSSGSNAKIASLINMYNYQLNMIRAVTGINEARDGTTPDKYSLVGIQKLAANNSNTATRHIIESGLYITKRVAQSASYRISDILMYSDFAEDFAKMIGKNNLEIITEIMGLHLHDFSVFIEIEPDSEEKAILEQNIQQAINAKLMDVDDGIDVRAIKNTTLANTLLKVKKAKRQKENQKISQANIDYQTQANIKSSESASQGRIKEEQLKTQMMSEIEKVKSQFELQKMNLNKDIQKEILQLKHQFDLELREIDSKGQRDNEKYREDRKDDRTDKQATQQGELIYQRKKGTPPKNFSKNSEEEDIIDNIINLSDDF